MALLSLWLQNVAYPARFDRQLIREAFGGREMVLRGLTVSQSVVPATNVLITIGAATIQGDDQTDQGLYLVENDAAVTLTMPAVPGSNKRIDIVSLRMNDPQAGGPAGNNATFVVTQGVASATPVAPASPTSAIDLVTVLRTAGDASVTNAMITDVAGRGAWPYKIDTAVVPAKLPPNMLYVRI